MKKKIGKIIKSYIFKRKNSEKWKFWKKKIKNNENWKLKILKKKSEKWSCHVRGRLHFSFEPKLSSPMKTLLLKKKRNRPGGGRLHLNVVLPHNDLTQFWKKKINGSYFTILWSTRETLKYKKAKAIDICNTLLNALYDQYIYHLITLIMN